jgi:hypothetical protein
LNLRIGGSQRDGTQALGRERRFGEIKLERVLGIDIPAIEALALQQPDGAEKYTHMAARQNDEIESARTWRHRFMETR